MVKPVMDARPSSVTAKGDGFYLGVPRSYGSNGKINTVLKDCKLSSTCPATDDGLAAIICLKLTSFVESVFLFV